ncbi:MAG: hypothetical protein WC216_10225 [Gallionella sp.]|jgi:hypothetical protein
MSDEKKIDDTQLKLYAMLVDQLQKYTTIFWQFPTALLAANAFVLDKFLAQPFMMLALAIIDGVLAYALHRLVIQQRTIISATKASEAILRESTYEAFIPKFSNTRVRAPLLIVYVLWTLTSALLVLAIVKICHHA